MLWIVPGRKGLNRRLLSSTTETVKTTVGKKKNWVGIVFFSSLCVGTSCLGVWQLQRYDWKVNLIETLKKRSQEPAIDFTDKNSNNLIDDVEEYRSRRIKISGVFDHDNEIQVGLRAAPAGLFGPAAQGMASNPQGYYIVTPLLLDDGNIVFVNRGWVPKNMKTWERPTGKVSLEALVSDTEPGSSFSPPNDMKNRKFIWLEKSALLKSLGSSAVISPAAVEHFLQQPNFVIADEINETTNKTQGPFPKLPSIINQHYAQPITHLMYAVTWFSLTTIGGYMTYLRFRR